MNDNLRKALVYIVLFIAAAFALPQQAKADTYGDMFAATDWLAKKYGVVVYTGQEPMESDTYGYSYGNTIVFNSFYISNPDVLQANLVSDVLTGFHRGANCTPAQLVAAHEFAHVLDYLTGYSARYELAYAVSTGTVSGNVSGYSFNEDGTVNEAEALADAFTAVECDNPTPAESALYGMLTS